MKRKKKMSSAQTLKYLIEYLIYSLEELTQDYEFTQWIEAEILAFIECLEVTSLWSGYHKYGIEDPEGRFLNQNQKVN